MIEPFRKYVENGLVRAGGMDILEAKSLRDKALARLEYVKGQKIDDGSASFVFEDVYECLREAAQSLMALKGLKPYSHEAVIAFLRDSYNVPPNAVSRFDRYRILRNKAVYRGQNISSETCREALDFVSSFVPELVKFLEKELPGGN